jgi:hypothetical protein
VRPQAVDLRAKLVELPLGLFELALGVGQQVGERLQARGGRVRSGGVLRVGDGINPGPQQQKGDAR